MKLKDITKSKNKPEEMKQETLYDYNKYSMKLKDRTIAFLIGFGLAVIAIHIFFGNIIVDLLVGIAAGIVAQPIYRNMMINRIKRQLTLQFRDLLDSLNSSISAGKVVNAAFTDAEKDMYMQYGETSSIYKEVKVINSGIINAINIETLLSDLGERS